MVRKSRWDFQELKTLYETYGKFNAHVIAKNEIPGKTPRQIRNKVGQLKRDGGWNKLAEEVDGHKGVEIKMEKARTTGEDKKRWTKTEKKLLKKDLMEFDGSFDELIQGLHDILPHRSKRGIYTRILNDYRISKRYSTGDKTSWETWKRIRNRQTLGERQQKDDEPTTMEETPQPRFQRTRDKGIGVILTGPPREIGAFNRDVREIAKQYNLKVIYIHHTYNKMILTEE